MGSSSPLTYVAVWVSAIAAFLTLGLQDGKEAVKAYVRRCVRFTGHWGWYLGVLVGVPLMIFLGALLTKAAGTPALIHNPTFEADSIMMRLENFRLVFGEDRIIASLDYGHLGVTWIAGLDGVYRYNTVFKFGNNPVPIAAKANWESENTLVLRVQPLMGPTEEMITLKYLSNGEKGEVNGQWGQYSVKFNTTMR